MNGGAGSRQTLGQTVYDRLKADIVGWVWKPGQRLPEVAVAELLGVSRTPVRDALRRLEREGLVVYAPQQGYTTRAVNLRDLNELYDLRALLEEHSAGLAAEAGQQDASSKARLDELCRTWELHAEDKPSPDDPGLLDADEHFHEEIAGVGGNLNLLDMLRSMNGRIRIIRMFDLCSPERIAATYEEHARIIRRVTDGDAAAARQAMRQHIETSHEHVTANAMRALLEMGT